MCLLHGFAEAQGFLASSGASKQAGRRMNLLTDPILTLAGGGKVSLPQLFAAMASGEVSGFAILRPHQRPAWHMFLVQLAALSLWTSKRIELPESEDEWAAVLRRLTPDHEDDAPWRIAVADTTKPAFLQAPVPQGLTWRQVATPDELDMLITARNHDLKQAIAKDAEPEDWIYALVSLQTCEGYGGKGNNGISRMNGGSSSRPLLGFAPARGHANVSVDPSAWWARDVSCLLNARIKGKIDGPGKPGGHSLLWCLGWPEGEQLDLRDLDPWFIEICRRVRLSNRDGNLSAERTTSKVTRVDAKAFNGNTGDPWAPVHKKNGKSLTLSSRDFDYNLLCDLLFSGDWNMPLLAQPGSNEQDDMLFVAEAFARGNSKTEGFKSRVVPVPGSVISAFATSTPGLLAEEQIKEIGKFNNSLKDALALLAAGGERDKIKKDHYGRTLPARKRFDIAADGLFFRSLWRRVLASNASSEERESAKLAFLRTLWQAAKAEFDASSPSIPCASVFRPRANVRARRALRNRIWREFPALFAAESDNEII